MRKFVALLILALLAWLPTAFIFAQQANTYSTAIPLTAFTATTSSVDQVNNSYRGAQVLINVTAYTSGNFTPKIQGKEPLSGTYYDILVGSPAISATGLTVLKIYPNGSPVAGAFAADILPQTWRVQMIGAGGPSATFSVTYYLSN